MLYVHSEEQLHSLAKKLSTNLKAPETRIRSAIAKAEGYSHISALLKAFDTTTTTNAPAACNFNMSVEDLSLLDHMKWWLEANVDMDTEIMFDNDGEVDSKVLLPVVERLLDAPQYTEHKKRVDENQSWVDGLMANSSELAIKSKSELACETDIDFFNGTEDSITDGAQELAKHKQLADALALLDASGLSGVSNVLKGLVEDAVVFSEIT